MEVDFGGTRGERNDISERNRIPFQIVSIKMAIN